LGRFEENMTCGAVFIATLLAGVIIGILIGREIFGSG
jgi:F0F1-type ATP synthase assembly protein I